MGGGIGSGRESVSAGPVISNSSPLIGLEQIGLLHILEALFGEVRVPSAVVNEVAPTVSLPEWILCVPLAQPLAAVVMRTSLGPGESEAITLALQEKAGLVILDDRPARRVAAALGLKVVGTLGLLLAAKNKGLIPAVAPAIEALAAHHFHVAPQLVEQVLRDAGEWT